jgi:uncharacterized membrane protein (UPF0182 family)
MTAWMNAQTDDAGVGRIVVYDFPRQSSIFGPQQVEALINQEPTISSQITLLGQAGSQVILGNMLVIPTGDALLYAQPLYLRATGTSDAPTELKFVIIATNSRIVIRPTLAEALAAIAGSEGAVTTPPVVPDQPATGTAPVLDAEGTRLVNEAIAAYERGQAALARGDWAAYGQEQATLEAILRQLVAANTALPIPVATPEAATPGE